LLKIKGASIPMNISLFPLTIIIGELFLATTISPGKYLYKITIPYVPFTRINTLCMLDKKEFSEEAFFKVIFNKIC